MNTSKFLFVSEASAHLPSPPFYEHQGGGEFSVIFNPLGAENADLETWYLGYDAPRCLQVIYPKDI